MARFLIAMTDNVFPSLDPAKAALSAQSITSCGWRKAPRLRTFWRSRKDADAILVTYAKLTRELLMQLTKCKAIGRFGLGVDNIDLTAAAEKGIQVNYVPDYCIHEVSDHAHGAAAGAGAQGPAVEQAGAVGPLGSAAADADAPPDRPRARPGRLRQHSAHAGAEGEGASG